MGDSFSNLFDNKLNGWKSNPNLLKNLDDISDEEIEEAHQTQKRSLINHANSHAENKLSNDILTVGFARRAAEYKRANLIFSDVDRLLEIGSGRIQFIFSGKAHPKDISGKEIIKEVVQSAKRLSDSINIVFIENYNMWLGRLITSGVDVWLNTPIRPKEASGTSGMKATLNGVPNFSILDGWWAEGCVHGKNGWAIGSIDSCDDQSDANSLYKILEGDIIKTYYNDKKNWVQIMRDSIKTGVDFTAHRMVAEYQDKYYKTRVKI